MDWADRVGNRIRLRDLHILMAVTECGSMSKASVQLAISRPVVSKTVSDLEHSLGVRIFDRHSQGVELTTYGKVLLDCGTVVFDEMRQGLRRIEFLTNPDEGDLRVGFPEVELAGIIPLVMERFLQRYPRVRLQVIHANTSMLQFQELRDRNVELLIGRVRSTTLPDDLALENLFDDSLVAVAGPHSPWHRRQRLKLADIIDEPWILPPYNSVPGPIIADLFLGQSSPAAESNNFNVVPSAHPLAHRRWTIRRALEPFGRSFQWRSSRPENSSSRNTRS